MNLPRLPQVPRQGHKHPMRTLIYRYITIFEFINQQERHKGQIDEKIVIKPKKFRSRKISNVLRDHYVFNELKRKFI